jgi:hypothetical protein
MVARRQAQATNLCKQAKRGATLRFSRERAAQEDLRAEETEDREHLFSLVEKLSAENTALLLLRAEVAEAKVQRV